MDLVLEIGNLAGGLTREDRSIKITRRDETTLELRAGVSTGPGVTYLTRSQALAVADALRAAAALLPE